MEEHFIQQDDIEEEVEKDQENLPETRSKV
jgi:hypothetical protein